MKTDIPKACFVVPCYLRNEEGARHFNESMLSLVAQNGDDWICVVVNDNSLDEFFEGAIEPFLNDPRFFAINNTSNMGPGACRNIGVRLAHEMDVDLIIFNDADDVAISDRLSYVTGIFHSNPDVDVVYGRFSVIDEYSNPVDDSALSFSIREIISANIDHRAAGVKPWKEMATLTGYCNLTSATAVRTSLALQHPFPSGQVSEDYQTWLAYATEGTFFFDSRIHCHYRIPQRVKGSATRDREGPKEFYSKKMRQDKFALDYAAVLARGAGWLNTLEYKALLVRHYMKSFETVYGEGFMDYSKSSLISATEVIKEILCEIENV